MIPTPRVVLASIVLNEAEMIPRSLEQHLDWPGLVGWVFVEGATGLYGERHPDAVTHDGVSVDDTGALLRDATTQDGRIVHVPFGWSRAPEERPGHQKEALRNAYCHIADELGADVVVMVDGDEFYTRDDQRRITDMVARDIARHAGIDAWLFRQRHVWRPASIADAPLMDLEVVGGYWTVPHLRVWRFARGARHTWNHNYIDLPGSRYNPDRMRRFMGDDPECVHLGFARDPGHRARTNAYYVHRGEGREQGGMNRSMYVDCRAAWGSWKPGDALPHHAKVIPYKGPVPEVLRG